MTYDIQFRQADLKERDEFHQRMIAKDKERQRNIVTKSDKKAYEEAAKRLAQVIWTVCTPWTKFSSHTPQNTEIVLLRKDIQVITFDFFPLRIKLQANCNFRFN